jgi:hypothetical protein
MDIMIPWDTPGGAWGLGGDFGHFRNVTRPLPDLDLEQGGVPGTVP